MQVLQLARQPLSSSAPGSNFFLHGKLELVLTISWIQYPLWPDGLVGVRRKKRSPRCESCEDYRVALLEQFQHGFPARSRGRGDWLYQSVDYMLRCWLVCRSGLCYEYSVCRCPCQTHPAPYAYRPLVFR